MTSDAAISLCSFHPLLRCAATRKPNCSLLYSASLFPNPRRRSRRRNPTRHRISPASPPSDDQRVAISFDFGELRHSTESRLRRFLSDGSDTFHDLRAAVKFDGGGGRVVFSCRRSSIEFAWNVLFWSLSIIVAFRAVVWIWRRRRNWWGLGRSTVVRRDRSLSGREVVVGWRRNEGEMKESYKGLHNPLSLSKGIERSRNNSFVEHKRVEKVEKLPEWWPERDSEPVMVVKKQELQREADRLVRAMMDNRVSGRDYKADDIIQLRQICKNSGIKVSFQTENSRDSFYRAAVDYTINLCFRVMQPNDDFQIEGESAIKFIAGLAENIGFDKVRAATFVKAAVAAKTRSLFLQSWALEAQGKNAEALDELAKICQIHQLFPPEENSPEMEMVASGIRKALRLENRKHLFNLVGLVCDPKSQRSAAEALGLINFNEDGGRY